LCHLVLFELGENKTILVHWGPMASMYIRVTKKAMPSRVGVVMQCRTEQEK